MSYPTNPLTRLLSKSDQDLLEYLASYWHTELRNQTFQVVVGGFRPYEFPDRNGNVIGEFTEVYSKDLNMLTYPDGLGEVRIFSVLRPEIEQYEYLLATVSLNVEHMRNRSGRLYLLMFENMPMEDAHLFFDELNRKKAFIHSIFDERGASKGDAGTIARSVQLLSGDDYTQLGERFFFELIQNADDNSKPEKGVRVKFIFKQRHVLFVHDGAPFNARDIYAITDIANSSKRDDLNTIGYKGVGFKIVFHECDHVLIRSGGYSFSFDKHHPIYDELRQGVYKGLGLEDTPWQLKPIWTDTNNYDPELRDDVAFMQREDNVSIAIKKKDIASYELNIQDLLDDPRFLLFLKKVDSIVCIGRSKTQMISRIKKGEMMSLVSDKKDISSWLMSPDLDFSIPQEIMVSLKQNASIPKKLQDLHEAKINFACRVIDGKIQALDGKRSNLFAYLPTSETTYHFPFVVNADFIITNNRQNIHIDYKWNEFLFEQIGANILIWIAELAGKGFLETVYCLLPDPSSDKENALWASFLKGYRSALERVAFLVSDKNQLIRLEEGCLDKTGIYEALGPKVAYRFLDKPVKFISPRIDNLEPIERVMRDREKGYLLDTEALKRALESKEISDWLTNKENNAQFLGFLLKEDLLQEFSELRIFLGKDGQLHLGTSILTDMGEDIEALQWLDYDEVLDQDVLRSIPNHEVLPLKKYHAIAFIKDVICGKFRERIVADILNKKIPADRFYSYVLKYIESPDFPAKDLKDFPLASRQGMLTSWNHPLYFFDQHIDELIKGEAIPAGLYYTLDPELLGGHDIPVEVLQRLFGIKSFSPSSPVSFIREVIEGNLGRICSHYDANRPIASNALLWSFILSIEDNISPVDFNSLKSSFSRIPVYSKGSGYSEVSSLYLASDFTDDKSLEELVVQFPSGQVDFISGEYLEYPGIEKKKIRSLFNRLEVRKNSLDYIKSTVIPQRASMNEEAMFLLTQEVYKNRDDDDLIEKLCSESHFKLKTKEGVFVSIDYCWLGEPYVFSENSGKVCPDIPVLNEVSQEYASGKEEAWRRFFSEKLKVRSLVSSSDILMAKLEFLDKQPEEYWQLRGPVRILKTIYELFLDEEDLFTSGHWTLMRRLPLWSQFPSTCFRKPDQLHFSSKFKPAIDFQQLFGNHCGVYFLSDGYYFDNDIRLRDFFEKMGVSQGFDRDRHNALINNMPTLDGSRKPANRLYVFGKAKFVGPGSVPSVDLSAITWEGKSLEDHFEFIKKLSPQVIFNYIKAKEPRRSDLEVLVDELLKNYSKYSPENKALLDEFKVFGKLLANSEEYTAVSDLVILDDELRSGIGKNRYIIQPLFNSREEVEKRKKYLQLFGIKMLKASDFKVGFTSTSSAVDFINHINERLVFIAWNEDSHNYLDIESNLKQLAGQWSFLRCGRISLQYPEVNPRIRKDDLYNFINLEEKKIYFRGTWSDIRHRDLFEALKKNVLGIQMNTSHLLDLLLNDPLEVISKFEQNGHEIPSEIKERFMSHAGKENASSSESFKTDEQYGRLTEDELREFRFIFERELSDADMKDENLVAHIKGMAYYRSTGFDVEEAGVHFKANLEKSYLFPVKKDGVSYKVMCRSALSGILYLGGFALLQWANDPGTHLLVVTKSRSNPLRRYAGLKDLDVTKADYWVMRHNVQENADVLALMASTVKELGDIKRLQFVYRVEDNYYQSIFQELQSSGPKISSGGLKIDDSI